MKLKPITIIRLVLSIISLLCILTAFIITICEYVNTSLKNDALSMTSYILTGVALLGIIIVLITNYIPGKKNQETDDNPQE